MNFRHIQLIIKREYLEKLRSPGFIIGTIGGVLVIVGLSFLPLLLKAFDQGPMKIAVVDPHNLVYPYIPQTTGSGLSGIIEECGFREITIAGRDLILSLVDESCECCKVSISNRWSGTTMNDSMAEVIPGV